MLVESGVLSDEEDEKLDKVFQVAYQHTAKSNKSG